MENKELETGTPVQDEDVILPEGYEDEDLFNGSTDAPAGDGENIFGERDTIEGFGGEGDGSEEPAPEGEPEAKEPKKEDGVGAEDGSSAPADAQQETESLFKFKDGELEIELKESDLPGLYRKAQEHGSISGQLAQARRELESVSAAANRMGFQNVSQMMEKLSENYRESEIRRLVDSGSATEEVARFIVESRMKQNGIQLSQQSEQPTQPTVRRDFRQELNDLIQLRPELRESLANGGKLPQEVVTACVKTGIPLRAAYAEYEAKEARAEAERVRQENAILKQNEQNAAKAPVKSVTAGGGDNPKGKDPFLEALLADD